MTRDVDWGGKTGVKPSLLCDWPDCNWKWPIDEAQSGDWGHPVIGGHQVDFCPSHMYVLKTEGK